MSDQQKLAWARRHNVKPPRFLVERVARATTSETEPAACCRHCKPPREASPKSDQVREAASTHVVMLEAQRKCQGLGPLIALLAKALPWMPPPGWQPLPCVAPAGDFGDPALDLISHEPPEPPPRRTDVLSNVV